MLLMPLRLTGIRSACSSATCSKRRTKRGRRTAWPAKDWRRRHERRPRSLQYPQDASAASPRSTASRSMCARARSSASSDRTAAASRPCSTAFSASCSRAEGEVNVDGMVTTGMRPCDLNPPRRQPDLPAAAGLSAALGARQSDPRRAGASGHDVYAPDRPLRCRARPTRPTR